MFEVGDIAIYYFPWTMALGGLGMAALAYQAFKARHRLWRLPGIFAAALAPFLIAATWAGLPIALTNNGYIGLTNYPSWQHFSVLRLGVNTLGDATPQWFVPSVAGCTISGGDKGSEVPSADGGCFNAIFPASGADVREWAAVPTTNLASPVDATTAVQAAVNAMANGKLLLGPYVYGIDASGLTCTHPMQLIGAASQESNEPAIYESYSGFVPTVTNETLLSLTNGCSGSKLSDFWIGMNNAGANSSGAAISLAPMSNVTFSDISINGACIGMDINGNTIKVDRAQITQDAGTGCGGMRFGEHTTGGNTVDPRVTNSTIQSSRTNPASFGMQFLDAGGPFVEKDDILYSVIGTQIIPGANQAVTAFGGSNTVLGDTTVDSPLAIATSASSGRVDQFSCQQCWVAAFSSTSGAPGINIDNGGAGAISGIQFIGLRDYSQSGNGVTIVGTTPQPTNIDFEASRICGAGSSAGTYYGIELGFGVSDVAIRNSLKIASSCDASNVGSILQAIHLDGNNSELTITDNNLYGWNGNAGAQAIGGSDPVIGSGNQSNVIVNNLGVDDQAPAIVSAATIEPGVFSIIQLSGNSPVSTINGCWPGRQLTIRTSGAVPFTTGGNIATTMTATINVPVQATAIGTSPCMWFLK